MSPAPRGNAEAFARTILDARADVALAAWAPWIASAQREASPLIRAVRVLAQRSLALTPSLGNGPSTKEEPSHVNSNGHESVTLGAELTRPRGPRIGRGFAPGESPRSDAGQIRGMLAERVIVSTELDPFLSLAALAAYSGLSVRNLRERLTDPTHPLPHYRVGGKLLVRRSDYDAWALRHRRVGAGSDVDRLVAEVLRELH